MMNKYVTLMIVGFLMFTCFITMSNNVQASTTYSTDQIVSIDSSPLSEETFVMAYISETDLKAYFKIYNINGTIIVGETEINAVNTLLTYNSIGVVGLNETFFAVTWFDNDDEDISFAIYDITGTLYGTIIDIDTTVGIGSNCVSISAFNSTTFVISWFDYLEKDIEFAICDSFGNILTSIIDVDINAGDSFASAVSCFNETTFGIVWYNRNSSDILYSVYDILGNKLHGPITVDNDVGTSSYPVAINCLNKTLAVIGYNDFTDFDTTIAIYDINGNSIVSPFDIDITSSQAGSSSQRINIEAISSSKFVASWYNIVNGTTMFAIFDNTGDELARKVVHSGADNTKRFQSVCSYNIANNRNILGENFIFIYNTPDSSEWAVYDNNGNIYDTSYTYSIFSSSPELIYYDENRYVGFSATVKLPNNDLLMFVRNGASHLGGPTDYGELLKSTDGGVTWSVSLTNLPHGAQSMKYFNNMIVACDATVQTSSDYGSSWTNHGSLNDLCIGEPVGSSISIGSQMEIVDNTLYMVGYLTYGVYNDFDTFLAKSTDGINWEFVSIVAEDCNEASIIYLGDSTFLSIARANSATKTYKAISNDMGETWIVTDSTSSLANVIWQFPQLEFVDENVIILTGRNLNDFSTGYILSNNNGTNWTNYQLIQSYRDTGSIHHNGGYSNIVANASGNGSLLVVFYSNALPLNIDYPGMWQTWITGGSYYNIPPVDDIEPPITPISYPESYGIGLILIVLACAIPFIGFIVKILGKDD